MSKTSDWREAHDAAKKAAGGMTPDYFTQPGTAGCQEAWAEAFACWVKNRDILPEHRYKSLLGSNARLEASLAVERIYTAYFEKLHRQLLAHYAK